MQIILVSHGEFSRGAMQAAEMIVGETGFISAVGLEPEDDLESMGKKIEEAIRAKGAEEDEILILSDLFYGSPFNSAAALMPKYKLHHITGMNLAMLLEAANMMQSGESMTAIVAACIESGKEGMIDVNEFLAG